MGSKILMDTVTEIAMKVTSIQQSKLDTPKFEREVARLREKEFTIYMLANQLPILQIERPMPKVYNQIDNYCVKGGDKYNSRIFKGINLIAFSDPNDILSYAIPQDFADKYIDSRICPRVTNVSVNVAPKLSAFGLEIVNPIAAHTNYDKNRKVLDLISNGTYEMDKEEYLNEKCNFIEMKPDEFMSILK